MLGWPVRCAVVLGFSVLPEIHLPFLAQTFSSARKWETALSSCKTGGKSQTKGTLLRQQL